MAKYLTCYMIFFDMWELGSEKHHGRRMSKKDNLEFKGITSGDWSPKWSYPFKHSFVFPQKAMVKMSDKIKGPPLDSFHDSMYLSGFCYKWQKAKLSEFRNRFCSWPTELMSWVGRFSRHWSETPGKPHVSPAVSSLVFSSFETDFAH